MKRPHILVTNDDGYYAPGIKKLTEIMREIGDVTVVAPEDPMSGTGHSITVRTPLRLRKIHEEPGLAIWSCAGTPVDCVKLGEQIVLRGKPDLVVSGINHGSILFIPEPWVPLLKAPSMEILPLASHCVTIVILLILSM